MRHKLLHSLSKRIFILSVFLLSSAGNSQWTSQTSGIDLPIRKIIFANENTGWAFSFGGYSFSSAGHIIKTTNGGANWTMLLLDRYTYNDVYFINIYTAYLVSGTWNDQGATGAQILKTTNGGANISVLRSDVNTRKYFNSIIFTDAGWVCGDSGMILKSTDEGNNWISQPVITSSKLNRISFVNNSLGWIIGNAGAILKTNNGGTNWSLQYVTVNNLLSIKFLNSGTGYITGENGTILKTTDSGNNWVIQQSSVSYALSSVYFIDVNTGWISVSGNTGSSKILKTINGGNNWYEVQAGNYYGQNSIFFVNAETGWSAGGYGPPFSTGTIIKTTNGGGVIGITQLSQNIPCEFLLSQNYPNPFNPAAKIKFNVKQRADINIIIYNSVGAEIEKIVHDVLLPGEYETVWHADKFPSGIYFIEMRTSTGFKSIRKAVLIK